MVILENLKHLNQATLVVVLLAQLVVGHDPKHLRRGYQQTMAPCDHVKPFFLIFDSGSTLGIAIAVSAHVTVRFLPTAWLVEFRHRSLNVKM